MPQLIMQTWKSKDNLPGRFSYWSETIKKLNPQYRYVLTDDDDIRNFIEGLFPWFLDVYNSYPLNIQRVDMFRYFWLYIHGGIYMDLDVECLQPLDLHMADQDVILGRMGCDDSFKHSIPNAIMASKPRQEFWLFVISIALRANKNNRPEHSTGPVILWQSYQLWKANGEACRNEVRNRILPLLPADLMPNPTQCIFVKEPHAWYPINWRDNLHRIFMDNLNKNGKRLSEDYARRLFPRSQLVTYWTHTWE